MIKLLDKLFNSKTTRYIFAYIVITITFYFFSNTVNKLIYDYLTIEANSFEKIYTWVLPVISIFSGLFIYYKFFLKNYQPSTNLLHGILLSTLLFSILRLTGYADKWEFITIVKGTFCYIDLIGILLFFITSLLVTQKVKRSFLAEQKLPNNPFVADDPIESLADDKLNYEKRADDLIGYLERSNFNKSFTIGIVGPWGNGKSSLIRIIEKKIEKKSFKDTIQLKFLPYLNHNENDIISEFFKQLSGELNKHSGKLSNHVLNYSDKLLKLYKNKNIKEFLTKASSTSNSSSLETYNTINLILAELGKKFIVFIDDLDRLSNKEVLQVLKLVRNTANFKNFIFVIALDKDYILNTLMKKNDIADHTFVDKFFQLEVYLPQIEKRQLKQDFNDLLKLSGLQYETLFLQEIETAIYRKDNLFDDYISNHRGAKRLVNQLVFDYQSLPDRLNTNDFLNFTYLKMKFPSVIKFLNENWTSVIPYNIKTKLCELKIIEKDNNQKGNFDIYRSFNFHKANTFNPQYEKYNISSSLVEHEELEKLNPLSHEQNLLVAKTLIVLFGETNKSKGHTSIKFGNNLRKLLQQKIVDNELTYDEFEALFNLENDFTNLEEALENQQTQDILDKIGFYNTNELDKIKSVTLVLLFIFNDAIKYGANPHSVLDTLEKFISRNINDDNKFSKGIWKSIQDSYINGDYEISNKLQFLSFLSENRVRMSFDDWGTSEDDLKNISLEQYKLYLNKKTNVDWDINDYSFYHAYHSVRKFHIKDTVNPILIEYLENNDIHLFCAQITETGFNTDKMFRTSDFAVDVFGTKQSYKEFVQKKNIDSKDLNEYLNFLELESFTNFSRHVRFEFSDFDLMKKKIEKMTQKQRSTFIDIVEFFIKSNDLIFLDAIRTDTYQETIPGYISSNMYNLEGVYYFSLKIEVAKIHDAKSSMFKHFIKNLDDGGTYKISDDEKAIVNKENERVIEIVSIQPNSYA